MTQHPWMGSNFNSDPAGALTPEALFPERGAQIGRLRAEDRVFDEICSDFELVAGIASSEGAMDHAVAECLAGLKEEIHRALNRCAHGAET